MTQALTDNSNPTAWDLLLALVGGFAGGLGNSRDQEPATLISGVAVATSLMPPLCAAGFGLAAVDGGLFLSALYEFGITSYSSRSPHRSCCCFCACRSSGTSTTTA